MVKLINKKIPASTLIEVLIAMVIIVAIFGIALKVFGNLMNSGVSFTKVQVQNQLHILSREVQKNGVINDPELQIDSVNYQLTANETDIQNISKLEIKASRNGKPIGGVKCLFKEKNED